MLYAAVARPLRDLHRTIDEGFEAVLKVADLSGIYARPRDPGLAGAAVAQLGEAGPLLSCRDLVVEYRSADGSTWRALNGVSFDVAAGETLGLAGSSGSGKSTLMKVLLGLVPDYQGSVKLFGVEIRNLDKTQLAQRLGYVPQVPFLIKGSVRDNIAYSCGTEQWSDASLLAAASKAQIRAKVDSLAQGLDSPVDERGRNFSPGEQQRMVLARLFLQQRELILLDEPTAALDTRNEGLIQESITDLLRGRSGIVIAHRLDTLRSTSRIIVLSDGTVRQSGTYEALSQRAGIFRDMLYKAHQSLSEMRLLVGATERPLEQEPAIGRFDNGHPPPRDSSKGLDAACTPRPLLFRA
jgi:ABC-type multidrug transport system fused ATPase/permease subunit